MALDVWSNDGGSDNYKSRLVLRVAMSTCVIYVSARAAVSVLVLTYASVGKNGLLLLGSYSLIYLLLSIGVSKQDLTFGRQSAQWLGWTRGMPSFLVLGIIAATIRIFLGHSAVDVAAYPLRVLIVVEVPLGLLKLSNSLFGSSTARHKDAAIEEGKSHKVVVDAVGVAPRGTDSWAGMNGRARGLLVGSYSLNALLWTWMVIHYRYTGPPFLVQSFWVMLSIWIFLASSWLHCILAILSAGRWITPQTDQ